MPTGSLTSGGTRATSAASSEVSHVVSARRISCRCPSDAGATPRARRPARGSAGIVGRSAVPRIAAGAADAVGELARAVESDPRAHLAPDDARVVVPRGGERTSRVYQAYRSSGSGRTQPEQRRALAGPEHDSSASCSGSRYARANRFTTPTTGRSSVAQRPADRPRARASRRRSPGASRSRLRLAHHLLQAEQRRVRVVARLARGS